MAIYYVATDGSNNNSGTIGSPLQTITHAISHISGGDTIYIRGGTYYERVYMSGKSGTAESPTIISGYLDEEVIIDGSQTILGAGSYLVQMTTTDYLTLTKLTVANSGMEDLVDGHGGGIYVNGAHCVLSNIKMHDINDSGIVLGDLSSDSILEYSEGYNLCMNNSDGLPYSVDGRTWGAGMNIRGTGNILRHCVVHDCWGEGISITKATNGLLEDNTIYDTYSSTLYCMNSVNCIVQRNLIYQTKSMGWNDSYVTPHWSTGLHHGNETYVDYMHNTNNKLINNIVKGTGILFHVSSLNGGILANNTFVNAYGSNYSGTYYSTYLGGNVNYDWNDSSLPEWGILLGGNVYNNIIMQEDTSVSMVITSSVTGNTYSNNIWNKTPNAYASGTNDIIGDPSIHKDGSTAAGALSYSYFRLLPNSPAINAGTYIADVSIDYTESVRGNPPDMGALEYTSGHVYYVATDGSNNYPGTITQPFQTITYGISALSAGDTLYLRGGTYVERIVCSKDGTSTNRITISGYPGETVIVDGEYTLPGGTGSYWYTFFCSISGDYVTLRDMAIKRSTGGLLSISGDYSYGINITGSNSYESGMVLSGSYDMFDNCSMTDNGNHYNIDGQTTWGSAICSTGSYNTIQNCLSYENRGEGLNAYNHAIFTTIQDCVTYNNGTQLYNDSATNTLIQRNLVYCTPDHGTKWGIDIGGETHEPSALVIINNLVYGCNYNLVTDSNVETVDNFTIANNTFVDASYFGVYFRPQLVAFRNSIFKNNIIIQTNSRACIDAPDSHDGFTFSNNCWNKAIEIGGQGINDIIGDPSIRKDGSTGAGLLSSAYFKLFPNSPAISAGVYISDVSIDYDSSIRRNPPSIGALEYYSTAFNELFHGYKYLNKPVSYLNKIITIFKGS